MQKLPGNDEPVAENKEITPKNNEPVAEDKPITPEIDSPVVANGTFATSLPDIVAKIFRPKKRRRRSAGFCRQLFYWLFSACSSAPIS